MAGIATRPSAESSRSRKVKQTVAALSIIEAIGSEMSTKNEAMSEDKSAAVFESIQSHLDAIFKMLVLSLILAAANLTLSLVLLFMVLDMVCSTNRSGAPLAPPPSAMAQVPANPPRDERSAAPSRTRLPFASSDTARSWGFLPEAPDTHSVTLAPQEHRTASRRAVWAAVRTPARNPVP